MLGKYVPSQRTLLATSITLSAKYKELKEMTSNRTAIADIISNAVLNITFDGRSLGNRTRCSSENIRLESGRFLV